MLSGVLRLCKLSFCRHLSMIKFFAKASRKMAACKFQLARHSLHGHFFLISFILSFVRLLRYSWSRSSGWDWIMNMTWIDNSLNFNIIFTARLLILFFLIHSSSNQKFSVCLSHSKSFSPASVWRFFKAVNDVMCYTQEVVEFQWRFLLSRWTLFATDVS